MKLTDCIFCKIANKAVPVDIIYEDSENIAFLDIKPSMKGQAVVISKQHITSDFKKIENKSLSKLIIATKETAKLIDTKLNTRCCLLVEGFDIDHLHFKLYPTSPEEHLRLNPQKRVDANELRKIADKIRNKL